MKKRTKLLNISLILGAAYHLLFIAGYLLQKPIFGAVMKYPPDTLVQIEPMYLAPVIIAVAVGGTVFAALVLLMKKNASKRIFIDAALLSGAVLIVERSVEFFAYSTSVVNALAAAKGEAGILALGLSRSAILYMDLFLLPLFVTAIVLMCCAGCIKEEAISQISINGSV